MKILITLFLPWAMLQFSYAQSMILSLMTAPEYPTTIDTIYIYAEYQFPSSPCMLDSKGVTPVGKEILAFAHYCLGPLTALCHSIDTFKLEPLPEGEYDFVLSLSTGMGDVPCSPGIIIDDLDTLSFSVSLFSGSIDLPADDFHVFPNPTSEKLFFSKALENNGKIISIKGKEIMDIPAGATEADITILPAGVYLFRTNKATFRWVRS